MYVMLSSKPKKSGHSKITRYNLVLIHWKEKLEDCNGIVLSYFYYLKQCWRIREGTKCLSVRDKSEGKKINLKHGLKSRYRYWAMVFSININSEYSQSLLISADIVGLICWVPIRNWVIWSLSGFIRRRIDGLLGWYANKRTDTQANSDLWEFNAKVKT